MQQGPLSSSVEAQKQAGLQARFTTTMLLQSCSALNPESFRSHAGARFRVNVVSKLR